MQHDVDGLREAVKIEAHRLAHTPLDAVAVHSLAKYASSGKTYARTLRHIVERCAQTKEIAHRWREVLAALLVNTLIIRVLSQTGVAQIGRRFRHSDIVAQWILMQAMPHPKTWTWGIRIRPAHQHMEPCRRWHGSPDCLTAVAHRNKLFRSKFRSRFAKS